jgi:hypothetical protein
MVESNAAALFFTQCSATPREKGTPMNAITESGLQADDQTRFDCLRRNRATAEIIEKGIALQENRGTRHAAEYFRQKMIGLDLASRVLLRPTERRDYGTHVWR